MKPIILSLTILLVVQGLDPHILSIYHNHQELEEETDKFLSDPLFKKRSCKIDESYKIMEVGSQDAPLNAIILCNVHAREIISSQFCLRFMHTLRQNTSMTKSIHFRIFYEANTQRETIFTKKDFCKRTNKNDVDLNRNFPIGFVGQKQGQQTNSGPYPISQPFSQCLEMEVQKQKPTAFVDIHTGQFSIYMNEHTSEQNKKVVKGLKEKFCPNCMLRVAPEEGQIFTSMTRKYGVKYSNVIEIYGGFNQNVNKEDYCFVMFNPLSERIKEFYLQRFNGALEYYFGEVIRYEMR